ncbi:MAG: crosslink repair DNA glycosylase YcaQ family protein [Chloroflexota bacterium]
MAVHRLNLTRAQIIAYRRRVGALDERLPPGPDSLRQAAWAGLQDSMPRAALLSIHARIEGTEPSVPEDPALVQLWGPRFSVYVVAAADVAVFTLGRLPVENARGLRVAEEMAARLAAFLDGRRMLMDEAATGLDLHNANAMRYATTTGTVRIRWDGARQPTVWSVPRPKVDPREARVELARRYLHLFGPGTPGGFAQWAGLGSPEGRAAFDALAGSLSAVGTPIGEGWILGADETAFLAPAGPLALARLLPSGDAHYLLQGADRDLLVPDADRRAALWTSRVWPGAVLVAGEIVGTWRRAGPIVSIQSWRRLARQERDAVEAEAASLPLPGLQGRIALRWEE